MPVFVTITAFEPDDPDYEEGSEFNYSVSAAVSDEVVGMECTIKVDDNGSSYETGGEIALDALGRAGLYECYVYRTPAGTTMPSARRPTARTYVTGHPAQT